MNSVKNIRYIALFFLFLVISSLIPANSSSISEATKEYTTKALYIQLHSRSDDHEQAHQKEFSAY